MILYAIGDIHGRVDLLTALLREIRKDAGDRGIDRPRIVLLGDMIDRGDASRDVIELLMSEDFRRTYEAELLMGNHEAWFLKVMTNPDADHHFWMMNGGAETVESYGVEFGGDSALKVFERFKAVFPQNHFDFLANLKFSLHIPPLFFVHAGVRPGYPLQKQDKNDMMWILGVFLRSKEDFGAVVVHGHSTTSSRKVEIYDNRIAVDTGSGNRCGMLSAAILSDGGFIGSISVRSDLGVFRDHFVDFRKDEK